jgi:hypothetical protein
MLAIVGLAIAVAILKPWGSSSSPAPAPEPSLAAAPSPSPAASPTPNPLDAISRAYDPLIFGDRQLSPDWGLWPAGYLSTFGFAMRSEPTGSPNPPQGSPAASGSLPSTVGSPIFPDAIDIPTGNHLLLIGVSTPVGFTVEDIHLARFAADGKAETVGTVLPKSPWPDHFTVIGIDGGFGPDRPLIWVAGRYRLDLTIAMSDGVTTSAGTIERSIVVIVEGPAVGVSTATPEPSSGPARP